MTLEAEGGLPVADHLHDRRAAGVVGPLDPVGFAELPAVRGVRNLRADAGDRDGRGRVVVHGGSVP